jgi:hypothetical protein
MKKMFFPKGVRTEGTGYVAGQVNEVEETPGSVMRWLARGCTIVEEVEKKVEEKKVEESPVSVDNKKVKIGKSSKKAKPRNK